MSYPVSVTIPVAWGEMDAFGHVNNIIYFRYFESARIAYFREVGMTSNLQEGGPILASTRCDFLKPLTYPDTVSAEARVGRVGNSSFTMEYRVVSEKLGEAAKGEGVIVYYDYKSGKSQPIPEPIRTAIAALEGTVPSDSAAG